MCYLLICYLPPRLREAPKIKDEYEYELQKQIMKSKIPPCPRCPSVLL
jgi:hypothetical protein